MKTLRQRIRVARALAALVLCVASAGLAMLSFAAKPAVDLPNGKQTGKTPALAQAHADWTVVASPNGSSSGSDHNELDGVTCSAANECWAVGFYYNGHATHTLVEKWSGAEWSIVSSPNTGPDLFNYLYDVTCTSTNNCWAVGYSYDSSTAGNAPRTLIERWNGVSWSIVSSPDTGPTQHDYLSGVTCTSANDCWAVGQSVDGNLQQTLIERWNGASWSIVPSPNNRNSSTSRLFNVACSSSNACWAVGDYTAVNNFRQTLILFWDGAIWSVASSPNADPADNNILTGITCVSANDCWAVGRGHIPGSTHPISTLILRWQGASWNIVTSPDLDQVNILNGVTCSAADNCWAVGSNNSGGWPDRTLTERWDGASWSVVPSPNANSNGNQLNGVACPAPYACWAVGVYDMFSRTLIEGRSAFEIVSVVPLANNHKVISCIGIPNRVNNLQASPDLNPANFATVSPPPPAADGNGAFQYDDANAGSTRFYRLAFP